MKHLLSKTVAVLTVLLLTGCQWNDNPVRTSLIIDTSDMILSVGESATRTATSEARTYEVTYTSSNPSVATVDQNGKVTAMSVGETIIKVYMPETLESWYAATSAEYKVIVKDVPAEKMQDVDKSTPLTLVAQADGKITVTFNNGIVLDNDIHFTINGGEEQTIAKNTEGAFDIVVKKGDVVAFYSLNSALGGSTVAEARGATRAVADDAKYINIRPSMKTEIYGNVMSMLMGKDGFAGADAIKAKNAFYGLFAGADQLVNNSERQIVLPATTLKEGCYQDMFSGCKGLEKAPDLPAPKLEQNCYKEMFYGCSKLSSVTCLATDITAEDCTKDWLGKAGTEATTKTLTTLIDMSQNSDNDVPDGWTVNILVTGIKLDKTALEMTIGDADVTLTATVEPTDATDKTVTWTSSKPEVATVDANGKVHVVAAGETIITVTSQADPTKTATCKVTVYDANSATLDVTIGEEDL